MGFRIPLGLGAILTAFLLISPFVGAKGCDTVQTTSQDYLSFLDSIYSNNGILTLQNFHDLEKPVVTDVSRDSTAIIDEKKGIYHPVELKGRQAVDTRAFTPFFEEMIIDGPFFIIGVLDDSLRVARDSMGYAYDKGLNERFEGRWEHSGFAEAAGAIADLGSWGQVFLGSVGKGDRITNVLRGGDFSVTTTCASNGCSQEMYSLFTKYLNVGASAQMILELGGGVVWRRIIPSDLRANINTKLRGTVTRVKTFVSQPTTDLKKAILDGASGLDDSTKQGLRGADGVPGLTSPDFSYKRFDDLPLDEKTTLFQYLSYVESLSTKANRLLDDLPEDASAEQLTELAQTLKDLDEALARTNIHLPLPEGKTLKGIAEDLKKKSVIPRDALRVALTTTADNATLTVKHLSGQLSAVPTISDLVDEAVLSKIPGHDKHSLATGAIFKPLAYYIVKRPLLAHRSDPFAATGAYSVPSLSLPVFMGEGMRLPDTWKVGVLFPPRSGTYADPFVDILINNGSDPGDAFKSLISLSGGKVVMEAAKLVAGREIPSFGLMLSAEKEKTYEMGPSIVAFGVATDNCPSCTLRGYGNAITFTGPPRTPAFGSVVEDSNAFSDGSTAIIFGHRIDMNFVDAQLDIVRAESEGKSCYNSCAILNNPLAKSVLGGNPAAAMFVMSLAQSLSAALGIAGTLVVTSAMYVATEGCYDCVDTVGGYYLHLRAPPQQASQDALELGANDALTAMLDAAGSVLGSVSDVLESEVQEFKKKALAESIRNKGAYVQFHMDGVTHGELRFAKLIEVWMKPQAMAPSSMSEKGSLKGESKDGQTVEFDKRSGVLKVNNKEIINNEDLLRMVYVDNGTPGIVVPTWAIITSFTADPAFEATKEGYIVKDTAFLQCFASHIPGGSPDTEFFHGIMGDVIAIRTDLGNVDFASGKVVGVTDDWSGEIYAVSVGSDYNVGAKVATYSVEGEEAVKVEVKTSERPFGDLKSIVFENGSVFKYKDALYVQIRRLFTVPGSYIGAVDLSPAEDGIAVKFTPTPDAPADVRKNVNRLNEAIKKMGGVNTIVAKDGAVAIFRDEDGQLWLRLFDRQSLKSLTVKDAYSILDSVLSGDGKHNAFEVLDGSLRIYRKDGVAYLSYVDPKDGSRKVSKIKSYKKGKEEYILETEDGKHVVSVSEKEGVVVASLDGSAYGPVAPPGSITQKKIVDVYSDPKTGDLVVKTEDGTHRVRLDVDSNGAPQLYVDDVLRGVVQFMQGPKGYVAYDADRGEWSFVAGLLTPLAEAFKGGIKISLNSDGQLAATPAAWGFKPNPYAVAGNQGLSLPLFGGPEVIALLLAIVAVFAIM